MDQIVLQLMQPSFYFTTALVAILLASSVLLIRINSALGARGRSILLVVPLAAALIALLIFPPSITILPGVDPSPHQLIDSQVQPGEAYLPMTGPSAPSMLSVTGSLLVIGLVLGATSAALSLLFSDRLTRKLLQVVDLEHMDFPDLTADIEGIAAGLGIHVPRIGLVEDLRPNAFTFGTGKRATVVFSLGMLTVLDRKELRAVAAHELAHIKNRDLWFKASTRALAWSSFFNPAAHLAAKAAYRERERLADETARSVLGENASLIRAIEKVALMCERDGPRPSLASRFGLSMTLSLTERGSLLSDHPSLAVRTRRFSDEHLQPEFGPQACLVLSLMVIGAGIVLTVSMGEVRADILHSMLPPHSILETMQGIGPHTIDPQGPWREPAHTFASHIKRPPIDHAVHHPVTTYDSRYYHAQ